MSDRRRNRKRKATPEEPKKVGGLFWSLTPELRHSLIRMARRELPNARKVGRERTRAAGMRPAPCPRLRPRVMEVTRKAGGEGGV